MKMRKRGGLSYDAGVPNYRPGDQPEKNGSRVAQKSADRESLLEGTGIRSYGDGGVEQEPLRAGLKAVK